MKLEYELVEDSFDDTTKLRTMTEQAQTPWGGWLIRTTVYSPHHISTAVTYVVREGASEGFETAAP
jgi:hypothetical protein